MSYRIKTIRVFEKEAKRLIKKFPSLQKEIAALIDELEINPEQGTPIGKDCYKIRLAVASKGKGKSGGARLITNIAVIEQTVYLLTIYDKSEQENLSDSELAKLLKNIPATEPN